MSIILHLKKYVESFFPQLPASFHICKQREIFQAFTVKDGIQCDSNTLYSQKHHRKANQFDYFLMSSVLSILACIDLLKTLWDEGIKTVAYLKKSRLGINGITVYEFDNHFLLIFSHLKVVRLFTSVNISKNKR